jgi:NAD(P)-dependent dehydrogenase (short-subunit alcohol dehydrogenase family)
MATAESGKRALVIGDTKGTGEAIVRQLRSSGAIVVTTARSAPADLAAPDFLVSANISTPMERQSLYCNMRYGPMSALGH